MKKWIPLYLGILCLFCGCGAEGEVPDGARYEEFQAGGSITEEEKERQNLEHFEASLQNVIAEAFEFRSVSVDIQNTDTSCVVSVTIESNDSEQNPEDIKAAVETSISGMFPAGTEFVINL